MALDSYQELDLKSKSFNTTIDDMSWTDKFIVRYIGFFKLTLVMCVVALILMLLV